jgi:MbtH protein
MTTDAIDAQQACLVLRNIEEQYSLWPASNDVPAGWSVVLRAASRQEALDYVQAHWTDMRPASVRT